MLRRGCADDGVVLARSVGRGLALAGLIVAQLTLSRDVIAEAARCVDEWHVACTAADVAVDGVLQVLLLHLAVQSLHQQICFTRSAYRPGGEAQGTRCSSCGCCSPDGLTILKLLVGED